MAAILERVRGAGVAVGRAAVKYHVVDVAVAGLGGALAEKAAEMIKTNKTLVKVYDSLKEWGDAALGFGLTMLYELFKEKIPNIPYLEKLVYGLGSVLMAKTFSVLMGAPFAIITSDGKLYTKNISPRNNTFLVLVDGAQNSYDTQTGRFQSDISEGVHDISIVGEKKALWWRQYTQAITGAGAGAGTGGGTAQTK